MNLMNGVAKALFLALSVWSYSAGSLELPPAADGEEEPTTLHLAIQQGELERVRHLLEQGANPSARDANGITPLHWVALSGNVALAELLLAHGATERRDMQGQTPLHVAAVAGQEAFVAWLLTHDSLVDLMDRMGATPLHLAAAMGHEAVVARLLQAGAAIETTTSWGATPLLLAIGGKGETHTLGWMGEIPHAGMPGRLATVRLLLARGTQVNTRDATGGTLLKHAIGYGRAAVVELLLLHGADRDAVDKQGFTLFHTAVDRGRLALAQEFYTPASLEKPVHDGRTPLHLAALTAFTQDGEGGTVADYAALVAWLLAQGANVHAVDSSQATPLHKAAFSGNTQVAQHLLTQGATLDAPDDQGYTPLHWAVKQGHSAMVRLLLDQDAALASKTASGNNMLHFAALKGDAAVMRLILEVAAQQSQLNYLMTLRNEAGNTPLHIAVYANQPEMLTQMLARNADPNSRDQYRRTPLHIAIEQGHVALARLLLERGADPRIRDQFQMTALHWTALVGDAELARELLARGAFLHRRHLGGSTPLHYAALAGHAPLVEFLLNAGAPIDSRTLGGNTPLFNAAAMGHGEVVSLLLARGADRTLRNLAGHTALHAAAHGGAEPRYVLAGLGLLEYVTLPKQQNKTLTAWLHPGIDHPEIIRNLLAQACGEVDNTGQDGKTPLDWALLRANRAAVETLLAYGADIHHADAAGRTPLHHAVVSANANLVEALLERGAWVDVQDREQLTPLHLAVTRPDALAVVESLLAAGADANLTDVAGRTPLQLAERVEQAAVIALLREQTRIPTQTAPASPTVGSGVMGRIRIEGATTFTPTAILASLGSNLDFWLATHPQVPLPDLLRRLEQGIRRGYQHHGFPHATVVARVDAASTLLRVRVHEGERYRYGAVRVRGATEAIAAALAQRLQQFRPQTTTSLALTSDSYATTFDPISSKSSEADWPTGEPAAFDPARVKQLDALVQTALRDLGYFQARLQTQLSSPPASPSAELLIDIAELGPPGIIQAFEVVGNRRDSPADILRYLGLTVGMPVDAATLERISQALRASGRFLEHEVTLLVEPEGHVLSLALVDYPSATPLAQALTLEEQTFLRLRDHLETALLQGEGLVIATDTAAGVIPIAIIAAHGVWLQLEALKHLDASDLTQLLSAVGGSVWLAKQDVRFFTTSGMQQVQTSGLPGFIRMELGLRPNPPQPSLVTFGIGFQQQALEPNASLFSLKLDLAPVSFLHLAHTSTRHTVVENVLTTESPTARFKIDLTSGRLLELRWEGLVVSLQANALEEMRRTLEASTPRTGTPDLKVEFWHLPLTVAAQAWLATSEVSPAQKAQATALILRLLQGDVLMSLTDLGADLFGNPTDFKIPEIKPALLQPLLSSLSPQGLRLVARLFPEDSWPWVVAREAVSISAGKGFHTEAELARLYQAPEVGPLGCLAIATGLRQLEHPQAAHFARRGLERLSAKDFQRDITLLLGGQTALAQSLQKLAASLRTLSDVELDVLAGILPAASGDFLRHSVQLLRANPNQEKPYLEILVPALARYWEHDLREQVRSTLERVAAGDPGSVETPLARGAAMP